METAGHLPEDLLKSVYRAVQSCTIEVEELLDAVPAAFRAQIPSATTPAIRLMRTLSYLNELRTADDRPPLSSFLEWLIVMLGPRTEVAVLESAVAFMGDPATIEAITDAERRNRAVYVGLVKRLYQQLGFEIDLGDKTSPVFVGWCDTHARVVGVVVGDLARILRAVNEQMGIASLAIAQVDGYVVFPDEERWTREQEVVFEAGLTPVKLPELRRQKERSDRRRASPAIDGLISRQVAWTVEVCQALSTSKIFERLRESTSLRLAEIVREIRDGHLAYGVIRVSTRADLPIAWSALLTTWGECVRREGGPWPFHLVVQDPCPLDTDELLEQVLQEQRVPLTPSIARSLLWDEQSVPVISCAAGVGSTEVRRIVRALLARKGRGVLLVPEDGAALVTPSLLGLSATRTRVCSLVLRIRAHRKLRRWMTCPRVRRVASRRETESRARASLEPGT
jgi:hypothetical protein